MTEKYRQNNQRRLALWMKLTASVLAILIILGLIFLYYYSYKSLGPEADDIRAFSFFPAVTGTISIFIIFIFGKVASEIGRGNSFSIENVNYFRRMACLGGILSISYIVRLIYISVCGRATIFRTGYCIVMFILGALFLSICYILSCLIKNAYEMKLENDLTI